uniref:Uncharacterized protein n=1 Tax=Ditylenchus dipsaci TaxID=166011 RepID=A0A915EMH6_9BILA
MQKKNDISDQIQLFEKLLVLGNSASSTAQCKRFRSVEKPAVLVNNSFLPIAAVGNSSFIPVDSQQSTSSSSISAPQKPSILKKSDYEVPRTKVPIGSIAALISHIAGPDSIFLRTAPLSGSYAKLQEYMQGNMESKQKWLGRDELKVSRILEQDEWRRNCILKKGSNGLDLTFQDIDFGAIVEILENSFVIEWSDRICRAPNEIAEWRKPLVLPFRLSTKFDSKYRSDPQSIAELRKLIPDEKVFFFNKLELEEEDESMADAKIFGKHSQETSKKMSMPETKEVLLFKSDESNINDCFDQIVMKIAKDNEDEKYAWA